jgi:hypothetical protein
MHGLCWILIHKTANATLLMELLLLPRWLLLEFWRMRQLSSGTWAVDSLRYVNDIYFLAAKDQAPQV